MRNKNEESESDQMMKLEDLETFSENVHCKKSKVTLELAPEERQRWTSHVEYILSIVGYSVGFGNLWRFPCVCNRNGGGAFLIPYLLFLMIVGFPMFYLESSLGQFSGKDCVRVWSFCPMLKGSGLGSVIMMALHVPYYMVFLALPIYYMAKSCSSVLPWTTCNNPKNSPLCVESVTSESLNISLSVNGSDIISAAELWKNKSLAHTSVEEFWQ